MKIERLKISALCLSLAYLSSGCAAWRFVKRMTTPKPKPELPAMWVMPFECENSEISKKMTEGFMENISPKVSVMDTLKYQIFLASRTAKFEAEKKRYAELEGVDESTAAATPQKTEPAVSLSSAGFKDIIKQVTDKEDQRVKFYHESGLDYLVYGSAKEKDLTDLEFGNLVTAETAEVRCLSLKTGEFWLDNQFKQGVFEVVAPDRIGKKFALVFDKKLKKTEKALKKEEKLRRKRLRLETPG